MTRALAAVAVVATAVAAGAVLAGSASAAAAADVLALFLGALLMLWLVRATRRASGAGTPSEFDRALRVRARPRPTRPGALDRLEREVVLSSATAFDAYIRVRPRLRAIAEHRLARRGLALDGSPEVRALLGDELWEAVRPDAAPPRDRLAAGMVLERQRALLDALESL